jgi:hypothetical protein
MKLSIKQKSERTVWAEFGDGFEVEIRHVTQSEKRRLAESNSTRGWDPKSHKRQDGLDQEQFYAAFAARAVVGWRGLTGELLRKWVDMEEYPEGDVPYSPDAAAALMLGFGRFDEFVTLVSGDLEMAEAARKAALVKNSPPTLDAPSSSAA